MCEQTNKQTKTQTNKYTHKQRDMENTRRDRSERWRIIWWKYEDKNCVVRCVLFWSAVCVCMCVCVCVCVCMYVCVCMCVCGVCVCMCEWVCVYVWLCVSVWVCVCVCVWCVLYLLGLRWSNPFPSLHPQNLHWCFIVLLWVIFSVRTINIERKNAACCCMVWRSKYGEAQCSPFYSLLV